ncbi:hypothetical protein CK594_01205, partial [Campylobacter coli]|nr:hypothetical protein [Campylobacter coli]
MKNVILIDSPGEWVETVLELKNVNISLVVTCEFEKIRERFGKNIENIFPRDIGNKEFNSIYFSDYNLNYEELEKYRSTQLKVEHYLRRYLSNDGLIQYYYHMALAFWLEFFSKNSIDMVFLGTVEHGAFWDSILIDIAKEKGISVFIISYSAGVNIAKGEDIDIKHIVYYNNLSFVNLGKINKENKEIVEVEKYLELLSRAHNKNSISKIV